MSCPLLIGRDARRIEDIWQYLYKGAYWRRGPVTMSAIAAVDTALWDIKAKIAQHAPLPTPRRRFARRVMVYGHASGTDIEDTVQAVAQYIDHGLQSDPRSIWHSRAREHVRCRSRLAVLRTRGKKRAARELLVHGTISQLRASAFFSLRKEFGPDIHLLHDAHHRLTPIEAARLGKELEPYHLFWLEDPTPAELQESFRLIRRHTITPLAVGEVFNTIFDCQQLIEEQLIDYIRTTVVHAGGITHLKKIASLAEIYQVRTGSHGATDLSPVCMGAALHFDISVHNFGIQEYMRHTPETDKVFPHSYKFKDGFMHPGDAPGLGVDIDEKLAAEYPYQRAYLPVNRKLDGTMHNW